MLRIVVTGPESCGKTTLAKALSEYFNVGYTPEYAREFLENKLKQRELKNPIDSTPFYDIDTLDEIGNGQLMKEAAILEKIILRDTLRLMICDTDLLTILIWSQEVFNDIKVPLLSKISGFMLKMSTTKDVTTVYLLCSPEGIIWEPDPLRENPNDRNRLFDIYKKKLSYYKQSYFILRGPEERRLAEAIRIINRFLK